MEFMYLGTTEISESLLLDKTSIKGLELCLFPLYMGWCILLSSSLLLQ